LDQRGREGKKELERVKGNKRERMSEREIERGREREKHTSQLNNPFSFSPLYVTFKFLSKAKSIILTTPTEVASTTTLSNVLYSKHTFHSNQIQNEPHFFKEQLSI